MTVRDRIGLSGRTALVTGAAGDIGRATALRLADCGATLILADIADGVEETASLCARLEDRGKTPTVVRFDVVDEAQVSRTFSELSAQGIVADLLFNNAGYQGQFSPFAGYDSADFRRVLDVNVTGVFHVLKHFARLLIERGQAGAAVNTASLAQRGAPNMAAYSASKAAVVALTKTAAKDLAHHGIRVNSVSPAFIGPGEMWDRQVMLQAETTSPFFADDPAAVAKQMISTVPLGRYGSLDEVAATVQFLLSDEASYLTAIDIEIAGGAN